MRSALLALLPAILPVLLAAQEGAAEAAPGWRVGLRPFAGPSLTTVGSYSRDDGIPWAFGGHAGLRLLAVPDDVWSFGVEGTWLSTGLERDEGIRNALLAGPVVELRVWDMVHLDGGVMAARQIGDAGRTCLDLQWAAGFEPWGARAWSPSLVYRSDAIFTTRVTTVRSVSLGVRYAF